MNKSYSNWDQDYRVHRLHILTTSILVTMRFKVIDVIQRKAEKDVSVSMISHTIISAKRRKELSLAILG